MENIFDELINSFVANRVGLTNNFLSSSHIMHLKNHVLKLHANHSLQNAGTSNNKVVHNTEVRSDQIYWLDRSHKNVFEDQFLDLIDAFIVHLNNTCYTGITSYEFHYAYYETGSFYTKHVDQFRTNDSRKFSMILYLNENWKIEDGGELCIHHLKKPFQYIPPMGGTSVFFSSKELLHEVMVTQKPRISITGWLKT